MSRDSRINPWAVACPFTLYRRYSEQGTGMGDYRNKRRYFEDQERYKRDWAAQVARDKRRAKDNPLPQCRCGLTWQEVEMQWMFQEDHWRTHYYCPACLPFEHYEILAVELAKLSDPIPEHPPERILSIRMADDEAIHAAVEKRDV